MTHTNLQIHPIFLFPFQINKFLMYRVNYIFCEYTYIYTCFVIRLILNLYSEFSFIFDMLCYVITQTPLLILNNHDLACLETSVICNQNNVIISEEVCIIHN